MPIWFGFEGLNGGWLCKVGVNPLNVIVIELKEKEGYKKIRVL